MISPLTVSTMYASALAVHNRLGDVAGDQESSAECEHVVAPRDVCTGGGFALDRQPSFNFGQMFMDRAGGSNTTHLALILPKGE